MSNKSAAKSPSVMNTHTGMPPIGKDDVELVDVGPKKYCKYQCNLCNATMFGEKGINGHINGRNHHRQFRKHHGLAAYEQAMRTAFKDNPNCYICTQQPPRISIIHCGHQVSWCDQCGLDWHKWTNTFPFVKSRLKTSSTAS